MSSSPNAPRTLAEKVWDDHVVTSGGRVLCVCALGRGVARAQRRAYEEVAGISWHGEFHRHDIGWRAIEREEASN